MLAIFLWVIFTIPLVLFTGTIANEKGYSWSYWMAGALFTGPVAFFAAVGLPDKKLRKAVREINA